MGVLNTDMIRVVFGAKTANEVRTALKHLCTLSHILCGPPLADIDGGKGITTIEHTCHVSNALGIEAAYVDSFQTAAI